MRPGEKYLIRNHQGDKEVIEGKATLHRREGPCPLSPSHKPEAEYWFVRFDNDPPREFYPRWVRVDDKCN